jgi:hypothetical protein
LILFFFFFLGRFLNGHVIKFFGIKDIAAFQAFNILGVFVAGNNSNLGVFAGGNHCFEFGSDFKVLAADCSDLLRNFKRQFGESFFPISRRDERNRFPAPSNN